MDQISSVNLLAVRLTLSATLISASPTSVSSICHDVMNAYSFHCESYAQIDRENRCNNLPMPARTGLHPCASSFDSDTQSYSTIWQKRGEAPSPNFGIVLKPTMHWCHQSRTNWKGRTRSAFLFSHARQDRYRFRRTDCRD